MSARSWLRRRLCPTCVPAERERPVIGILERSAEGLDRISGELRRIRQTAADGPNPLLGPHSPQRKERRR
jgi:hypothetical protein